MISLAEKELSFSEKSEVIYILIVKLSMGWPRGAGGKTLHGGEKKTSTKKKTEKNKNTNN